MYEICVFYMFPGPAHMFFATSELPKLMALAHLKANPPMAGSVSSLIDTIDVATMIEVHEPIFIIPTV